MEYYTTDPLGLGYSKQAIKEFFNSLDEYEDSEALLYSIPFLKMELLKAHFDNVLKGELA